MHQSHLVGNFVVVSTFQSQFWWLVILCAIFCCSNYENIPLICQWSFQFSLNFCFMWMILTGKHGKWFWNESVKHNNQVLFVDNKPQQSTLAGSIINMWYLGCYLLHFHLLVEDAIIQTYNCSILISNYAHNHVFLCKPKYFIILGKLLLLKMKLLLLEKSNRQHFKCNADVRTRSTPYFLGFYITENVVSTKVVFGSKFWLNIFCWLNFLLYIESVRVSTLKIVIRVTIWSGMG